MQEKIITENIMGENFPDLKEDTNPHYACMREKVLNKENKKYIRRQKVTNRRNSANSSDLTGI
jgi:hypothetical protein